MSGRGRGVNNAPAWMTRQGGPGSISPQDSFGRATRPGMSPPDRPVPRGLPSQMRGPLPPFEERRRDDRGGRYDDRGGQYDDRRQFRGPAPGPPRGRAAPPSRRPGDIRFRSYEEEREWVNERRHKRQARKSKFDQPPTAQQLATDAAVLALANPAATDFAGIPSDRNFAAVPQQTRHARRLYVGNLPPNVTDQELHVFFRSAIQQALVHKMPENEDPILSVYINHERRFSFLEFKTVEMATACMALDGIDIHGKGKVKVKRPNDYNPTMAPKVHPSAIPQLDVSRLGIINGTVEDGPNKVFIGGLHYHLTEDQVLELLQAFGKVKAFHLVKNDPDSLNSKGYCFVEYSDPSVTQVAVIGLNGMDLGGGKVLTARVAGERSGGIPAEAMPLAQFETSAPPPDSIVIRGYDVEALVDAAMGLRQMPTTPMYFDQFGVPLTRTTQSAMEPSPVPPPGAAGALVPGPSALDIANAALDAAFGKNNGAASTPSKTRVLVLRNMVSDEDLATDAEYNGLVDEVKEECAKFGKLLGMKVPRASSEEVQPSAVRKIFLEYATIDDAAIAERELAGRQFGPNVVQTSFHDEQDYLAGKLH